MFTPIGRAVSSAFDLDQALEFGIKIELDSLRAEEWRLLRLIRAERDVRSRELQRQHI